jgi:methionine aminotransferase
LAGSKFKLLPCKGSYFQCVSYGHFSEEKDSDFAIRLVKDFGVATIPVSAFYTKRTDDKILRFCFAKRQDTLEKAVERLNKV